MSDTPHSRAIPSLPPAQLDLINRSKVHFDRFAPPKLAINYKFKQHLYFAAFLIPFLLFSYASLFFSLFTLPRNTTPLTATQQAPLLKILRSKASLAVRSIEEFQDERPSVAIRSGIGSVRVLASSGAIEHFSEEELEYAILREAGHQARLHSLREILFGLALVSIAASMCTKMKLFSKKPSVQYGVTFALALLFSLAMIQIGRLHAYEIEYYALERQKNPQAMMSANEKLYAAWGGPKSENMFSMFFSRSVPYDSKINIAKSYKIGTPIIPIRTYAPEATPHE